MLPAEYPRHRPVPIPFVPLPRLVGPICGAPFFAGAKLPSMKHSFSGRKNPTVVVLLEKFALLTGRQSAATRAKFVEQRARRKKALAGDPLGPVGNVMFHLRGTFDSLKEFLDSEYGRARW